MCIHLFIHLFILCACVGNACVHMYRVHASALGGQKRALDPKELELYSVSYYINAGNGTQVTRESSEHS